MELAARLLELMGGPVAEVTRRAGFCGRLWVVRRSRSRRGADPTAPPRRESYGPLRPASALMAAAVGLGPDDGCRRPRPR